MDKLFIRMEKSVALRFTWEPNIEEREDLYLRTKMAFKLEQFKSDPVQRCHNHLMGSSNYVNQTVDANKGETCCALR